MQIVIVTGMSGAGKSTALNVLEDQGYYCVDNMPVPLIPHFAKLAKNQEKHREKDGSKGHETVYDKIALGVDIRNGDALGELRDMLNNNIDERYRLAVLTYQWLNTTRNQNIYTTAVTILVRKTLLCSHLNIGKREISCQDGTLERRKHYLFIRTFNQSGILLDGTVEDSFHQ